MENVILKKGDMKQIEKHQLNGSAHFEFSPSEWVPFKDKKEIDRVVAIKRRISRSIQIPISGLGNPRCRSEQLLDDGHVQANQALFRHGRTARDDSPEPAHRSTRTWQGLLTHAT